MSVYTRLGSGLWTWEPWVSLSDPYAKLLWLGLYTSAEAKRVVPGLFHGSIASMADAAQLRSDDVLRGLDLLREQDMVEYDTKLRVLRLTELPDPGESPASGNVIRGWWSRFKSVPACAVRDSHVATLRWIMEEWSRENGKAISANHEEAWSETFGDAAKMKIPPTKKRRRRMAQQDLFEPFPEPSEARSAPSGSDSADFNKIRDSETISKPFRNGLDQDRDPDQDLDLSSSAPQGGSGGLSTAPGLDSPWQRSTSTRPALTLVPPPALVPFTVERLLAALDCRGPRPTETQQRALGDAMSTLGDLADGVDVSELLGQVAWLRVTVTQACRPGVLRDVVARARSACDTAAERAQMLREVRERNGF